MNFIVYTFIQQLFGGKKRMKKVLMIGILFLAAAAAFAGNSSGGIDADPKLVGRWEWISMKVLAASIETGSNSSNYILEFISGGGFAVKADCRNGKGTYRTSGGSVVNIGIDSIDGGDCGAGSHANEFIDLLNEGSFIYSFEDGGSTLMIQFANKTGTAIFKSIR